MLNFFAPDSKFLKHFSQFPSVAIFFTHLPHVKPFYKRYFPTYRPYFKISCNWKQDFFLWPQEKTTVHQNLIFLIFYRDAASF